jgi:dolichol-phosphate mannosyltransferase
MGMEDISIIIPVKDEEVGLNFLLENFKKSSIDASYKVNFIFVIDVRTSDSSKVAASKFSDTIIDQMDTIGKGAAVKQAIEYWKNNSTQKVIFLDADGSYSFDSVIKVLEELERGADVVSGSRFLSNYRRPKGMSRLHNLGNRVLSKISSIRNRRKITDLCTGLWGFSEPALKSLEIKSNGFDLEAEIAGLVRRKRLSHIEVNVAWSQRKGGISKLRSFTDGFIIFARIILT